MKKFFVALLLGTFCLGFCLAPAPAAPEREFAHSPMAGPTIDISNAEITDDDKVKADITTTPCDCAEPPASLTITYSVDFLDGDGKSIWKREYQTTSKDLKIKLDIRPRAESVVIKASVVCGCGAADEDEIELSC